MDVPTYLVLHGYIQSSEIIRKKIKNLLGKNVNLIIPDAPLKVESDKYGWFPLSKCDLQTGITSVDDTDIKIVLDMNLPSKVDGVIAFSQGCLAAGLLIGSGKVQTNKLLLFSPIPCPNNWNYTIPNGVDCQLYYGVEDTLVTPARSLLFIPALGNNNIAKFEHRWGHVIPSTTSHRKEYIKFLTS